MKKLLTLLFSYLLAVQAFAQIDSSFCGCTECPVFMPDNFSATFNLPIYGVVNDNLAHPNQGLCKVRLKFDHEYLGDLSIILTSPAGQSVQLIGPVGFWGPTDFSLWDVTFVPCDSLANPDPGFSANWQSNQSWGLTGVFLGSYHPFQSCLEAFNTGAVNGTWKLTITDNQSVDVGNLYAAELFFCDPEGLQCDACDFFPETFFVATPEADSWAVGFQDTAVQVSNYTVQFGDGQSFNGFPAPATHVYPDTGSYTIQWIVSNGCNKDTAYQTVHVSGLPPAADFSVAPVCVGSPADFNVLFDDHVQSWHWILPGATPSESFEKYPVVTYNVSGTYDVMLVVSNNVGADTIVQPGAVSVSNLPAPVAGFTFTHEANVYHFVNNSTNEAQILWQFPDGSTSNADSADFIFPINGIFTVTLFATNNCGADEAHAVITVNLSVPVSNFIWASIDSCHANTIQYHDISQGEPTIWEWYFEGGTPAVSNEPNPLVTYAQDGDFLTVLTVRNISGENVTALVVPVHQAALAPATSFTGNVVGGDVICTNTTQNATSYVWLLNGDTISTSETPSISVAQSGTYAVTLIAYNACTSKAVTQFFTVIISGTNELDLATVRASVMPNPGKGAFFLEIESAVQMPGSQFQIQDVTGRNILTKELNLNVGKNVYPFDIQDVAAGLYFLKIQTSRGGKTIRFVIGN